MRTCLIKLIRRQLSIEVLRELSERLRTINATDGIRFLLFIVRPCA